MMKKIAITSAVTILFAAGAAPTLAKHHEEAGKAMDHSKMDHSKMDHSKMLDAAAKSKLKTVLADPRRDKDRARDQHRHPMETLEFFGVTPSMTVGEYAPGGGGWYTNVLAPYLADSGQYVGVNFNPAPLPFPEENKAALKTWGETFPGKVAEMTGLPAEKIKAYSTDQITDELAGTADFIIIPRMMHNLMRWNVADNEIKALRKMLKDDGHIGIIQHRAKDDAPFSYADGNKGYLRTDTVVSFMKANGFELVKQSEVNANPKDTADYEDGVWTLPPILRTSKDNPEDKAKYEAIGESDRMTLLFMKLP